MTAFRLANPFGYVLGLGRQSPNRNEPPPWKSIWLMPSVWASSIQSPTVCSLMSPKLNRYEPLLISASSAQGPPTGVKSVPGFPPGMTSARALPPAV